MLRSSHTNSPENAFDIQMKSEFYFELKQNLTTVVLLCVVMFLSIVLKFMYIFRLVANLQSYLNIEKTCFINSAGISVISDLF